MASACDSAESTSRVRQPTAPGPAPASQTWPGSNSAREADSRPSDCSRLIPIPLLGRDALTYRAYTPQDERRDAPIATWLDDRRLLGGGGQGCLRGTAQR